MKDNIKKVLITGGAGFIGSNVALKLVEKGYEVVVLDSLSSQVHGFNPENDSPLFLSIKGKVEFICGDVLSKSDWEKSLSGVDAIIHLAAETGTGQSMYEIEKYVGTNIGGTAILLDILTNSKHSVKKIIVAESRAVYGEGKYFCPKCGDVYPNPRVEVDMKRGDFECKCPNCRGSVQLIATPEDSKIHPTSVYGITKQVQGQLVHLVCQNIGIKSVTFRYQNVYGPGQSLSNPYTGILSIFSTIIKNKNEINIFEDGKESRDFVYIDDIVDATIMGLECEDANGLTFNVGTGKSIDVLTVAHILMETYKEKVPLRISGNYRLGDIRHNYADISLAGRILGFSPKWNFEDGIKNFVSWVNTQKIQEDKYIKSIEEMEKKGLYK